MQFSNLEELIDQIKHVLRSIGVFSFLAGYGTCANLMPMALSHRYGF